MKRISQTISDPKKGDCFRACLCSLLEISISEVPNFAEMKGEFWNNVDKWLRKYNNLAILTCYVRDMKQDDWEAINGCYGIAGIPSQKYKVLHAVIIKIVGCKPKIIHDPQPDNLIYKVEDIDDIQIIFPLNPRCLKK